MAKRVQESYIMCFLGDFNNKVTKYTLYVHTLLFKVE